MRLYSYPRSYWQLMDAARVRGEVIFELGYWPLFQCSSIGSHIPVDDLCGGLSESAPPLSSLEVAPLGGGVLQE